MAASSGSSPARATRHPAVCSKTDLTPFVSIAGTLPSELNNNRACKFDKGNHEDRYRATDQWRPERRRDS
jgi:hypothetical protein